MIKKAIILSFASSFIGMSLFGDKYTIKLEHGDLILSHQIKFSYKIREMEYFPKRTNWYSLSTQDGKKELGSTFAIECDPIDFRHLLLFITYDASKIGPISAKKETGNTLSKIVVVDYLATAAGRDARGLHQQPQLQKPPLGPLVSAAKPKPPAQAVATPLVGSHPYGNSSGSVAAEPFRTHQRSATSSYLPYVHYQSQAVQYRTENHGKNSGDYWRYWLEMSSSMVCSTQQNPVDGCTLHTYQYDANYQKTYKWFQKKCAIDTATYAANHYPHANPECMQMTPQLPYTHPSPTRTLADLSKSKKKTLPTLTVKK